MAAKQALRELREQREALLVSQEAIAAAAGVSQGLVSKFEKGKPIRRDSESKIRDAYEKVFAEFVRNSSANTEHEPAHVATQAPAMPHLTLVSPPSQAAQPALAELTFARG